VVVGWVGVGPPPVCPMLKQTGFPTRRGQTAVVEKTTGRKKKREKKRHQGRPELTYGEDLCALAGETLWDYGRWGGCADDLTLQVFGQKSWEALSSGKRGSYVTTKETTQESKLKGKEVIRYSVRDAASKGGGRHLHSSNSWVGSHTGGADAKIEDAVRKVGHYKQQTSKEWRAKKTKTSAGERVGKREERSCFC